MINYMNRRANNKVNLYDSLKSSYGDKNSRKSIESKGYVRDRDLSSSNQEVWYNPKKQKLLYNVAGTHNLADVGTDLYLGLGKLKDTNRYKQAQDTLNKAKAKYNPYKTAITGHSLGASIGQGIRSGNDKFVGLDAGYTIGQKTRSNNGLSRHFRSSGDLVSLLGGNATHMKTLDNPNFKTGIIPLDILNAHNVSNIKNSRIFV